MKKIGLILSILIIFFVSNISSAASIRIKRIDFGKYDEYAFLLYERTTTFPKKTKVISAVVLEVIGNSRLSYKFVLKMPVEVRMMKIWDVGEWRRLRQGDLHASGIVGRSVTHVLDGKNYVIEGKYKASPRGGFIRGVYRGETLPIGNYSLEVFINDELIKTIKFEVIIPPVE